MGICRPGLRSYNTDTLPAKGKKKKKKKKKITPSVISTEGGMRINKMRERE